MELSSKRRCYNDYISQVLYQEVDRYNRLLLTLHQSLKDLELGVQGLVVVTPELERIMGALLEFKVGTDASFVYIAKPRDPKLCITQVPGVWSECYPSLKPLGSWMRDLVFQYYISIHPSPSNLN